MILIVGTPIANRQQTELEDLIGFFANTLALRVNVQPETTFRELLRQVREVTLDAYANQDVPFERLVEELQPRRELNRNPFFQVMFGVQNMPHRRLYLPGLEIGVQDFSTAATRFDLECHVREEDGELLGLFIYSTDLFERQTMENMLGHFQRLLEAVVANPKQRVRDLQLLTADEEWQQLIEWNSTNTDYERDQSVHELFEEQVARTPSNIAIEFGDQRLTYAALNRSAGELATRLQRLGVGRNTVVGYFPRTLTGDAGCRSRSVESRWRLPAARCGVSGSATCLHASELRRPRAHHADVAARQVQYFAAARDQC